MSITIELPPEQEQRIATEARKYGLSPEEYLTRVIIGDFSLPAPRMTPKEALEVWKREGVLPIWADRPEDSIELARKLRYEDPEGRVR